MRVIAGEFRGRHLAGVKGLATRPILDRVKESLFSILDDTVDDARVLDLFSGSGTIGIEALSRGASSVVMVDKSRGARVAAEKNIATLCIEDRVQFVGADACRTVRRLGAEGAKFELIFVDPPYFQNLVGPALQTIHESGILAAEGMVVVRQHKKEQSPVTGGGWCLLRQRQIGDTVLTFLGLRDAGSETTMTGGGEDVSPVNS
jgi:16S rRNA (guanine(966)-N(2))-methyltransferase RsmD